MLKSRGEERRGEERSGVEGESVPVDKPCQQADSRRMFGQIVKVSL